MSEHRPICPDPGCDETMHVDPESPNVWRCPTHGPMREVTQPLVFANGESWTVSWDERST